MKLDRTLRNVIVAGVISSLVATLLYLYFLDPILRFVGRLAVTASTGLYHGHVDSLIRQMAVGVVPKIIYSGMNLFFSLTAGIFTGLSVAFLTLALLPSDSVALDKVSARSLIQRLGEPGSRRLAAFLAFLSFVTAAILIFSLSSQWVCLRTTTSFEQHMRILAPYITDQELKELWSSWASMQTLRDYQNLYDRIDRIASGHHIQLPANTLFSIQSLL